MDEAVASSPRPNWGVPDPRDESAYPKAAPATSMQRWGWEFLRRRADYRQDWERWVRRLVDAPEDADEAEFKITLPLPGPRRGWRRVSPFTLLEEKYHLDGLCIHNLDPRRASPPHFKGFSATEVMMHAGRVELPKVLFQFDLTWDIDQQVDAVRKALHHQARRLPGYDPAKRKLQVEKFPTYLRLLDFDAESAKNAETGRHLFPGRTGRSLDDAIRKGLAAARRMQDAYLKIALHR